MLELRTKFGNFGNFGNFGHISDGLRKQYSVRTQCCNLIGSEPLYIPCIAVVLFPITQCRVVSVCPHPSLRHPLLTCRLRTLLCELLFWYTGSTLATVLCYCTLLPLFIPIVGCPVVHCSPLCVPALAHPILC